jgi:hypothetical protein
MLGGGVLRRCDEMRGGRGNLLCLSIWLVVLVTTLVTILTRGGSLTSVPESTPSCRPTLRRTLHL